MSVRLLHSQTALHVYLLMGWWCEEWFCADVSLLSALLSGDCKLTGIRFSDPPGCFWSCFLSFFRQRYSVRRTASIGAAGGGGLGGWRRCGPCCDCVYEKRAPYAGKLAYLCYSSCWGGGSPWREEVRTRTLISRGLYTLYSCLNIRWWYRHSFGRSSGRWHGDDHAVRDRAA